MKIDRGQALVLITTFLVQTACTNLASEGACPSPTVETKLLTNAEDGYCLLYPAEYSTSISGFIVINPITGPGDIPGDAWVRINTEIAAGRTAAEVRDEQVAALDPGFNITITEVTVDGEPAMVIDGLPGQDSQRIVLIVHNDRLYKLVFVPWILTPEGMEEFTPLGKMYDTVMTSFHFMPPT